MATGVIDPLTWIWSPNVAIGVEAAIETDGGGPVTLTVPFSVGWRASWYGIVLGTFIVFEHVWLGVIVGHAKAALFATG